MTVPARYSGVAIALHWIVAALMILAVALGWLPDLAGDASARPVIDLHKSVGLTVLGLAVLRLLWRLGHRPPALPVDYGRWERIGAHAAHWALYFFIFALPVSGYLHDSAFKLAAQHPLELYWTVPVPRLAAIAQMAPAAKQAFHDRMFAVHVWLGYALYGVFALHVAGALKHQFLDRERELQRMWPG
jgi:cytochrome b561